MFGGADPDPVSVLLPGTLEPAPLPPPVALEDVSDEEAEGKIRMFLGRDNLDPNMVRTLIHTLLKPRCALPQSPAAASG